MNRANGVLETPLLRDLDQFETRDGVSHAFVEFEAPEAILCWEPISNATEKEIRLRKLHVGLLCQEELETLHVWSKLSSGVQDSVINWGAKHKGHMQDRMAHARKGRKDKYPDLPDELTCTECGNIINIQKGVLAQRITKLGVLADDYIKSYKCKGCNKTDYTGVPDQMECGCGHIQKYLPSAMVAMAKKKGISVEDMVSGYACQTCNPTKGRKKGSKNNKNKK